MGWIPRGGVSGVLIFVQQPRAFVQDDEFGHDQRLACFVRPVQGGLVWPWLIDGNPPEKQQPPRDTLLGGPALMRGSVRRFIPPIRPFLLFYTHAGVDSVAVSIS